MKVGICQCHQASKLESEVWKMGEGLYGTAQRPKRSLKLSLDTSFSSCDMHNHNSGWSIFISHKSSQDKWSPFPQVTTAKRKVFFRCISPSALSP